MNISIIGTGYVGLTTGVCLAEIGHQVTCIDINKQKVEELRKGHSPIYEPGVEDLLRKNNERGRLSFTTSFKEGLKESSIIYIAVGTPQNQDGSADLSYIMQACVDIGTSIEQDVVVVTKSTVPVGTNAKIKQMVIDYLRNPVQVDIVSNPEFLREGSAIQDAFNGDRIVIGADNDRAANLIEEVNRPFNRPVLKTTVASAEMIKYASNAFLATKICFINEMANISEKVGADVQDVARGMGMDQRIGRYFLNAGIGYGGSCFPKDTHALLKISESVNHRFRLLESAIKVNETQKTRLVRKAKERLGTLAGKRVALLGLSFKPDTDDMREAPSINIAKELDKERAKLVAYDPIAMENAKKVLPKTTYYAKTLEEAIRMGDIIFILTDWMEIKRDTLNLAKKLKMNPIIFDGRNCYSLEEAESYKVEYHSIGRDAVIPTSYLMYSTV